MKPLILSILLLAATQSFAQYTGQGKIEYEKKINLERTFNDLDDDDKRWMENFKSQLPKLNITYFDLYFNTSKSLYKPGRESENPVKMWFANPPANENVVYTDYKAGIVRSSKLIYEENFLVQDSMRKMKWKIMDEIRTIANYKCRKAVGRICDSVVVVAFYTDDIPTSGGPEMFCGLPGMIMELAIPRLHTTWVATKVDIAMPKESDIKEPEKGKKVTQAELYDKVKDTFARWGKGAQRYVWWVTL